MFVFVLQVRNKWAIDARSRVSVNLKTCYSGCMSTVARPSKRPSQKKIRVNKTEMSIIIGMAGECQQIKDQNQWTTVRTEDIVKVHFPCIFAWVIETPWYTGECRATSCLSCSATLSKQFPHFHSNYTANVVFQGQLRHARFFHPSSRTSSECVQELPTLPIFLTEKVHVGIERNRAIPTKWRTGSSCRCVGSSRHMLDCCAFEFLDGSVISTLSSLNCVAARSLLRYFVCCCFSSLGSILLLIFFNLANVIIFFVSRRPPA